MDFDIYFLGQLYLLIQKICNFRVNKLIRQSYNVNTYFPTTSGAIHRVQTASERYGASSYSFLGDVGMSFTFPSERKARGFMGDVRGLDFLTALELSRKRLEQISIAPVRKKH